MKKNRDRQILFGLAFHRDHVHFEGDALLGGPTESSEFAPILLGHDDFAFLGLDPIDVFLARGGLVDLIRGGVGLS